MADELRILHYSCGIKPGAPHDNPIGYIEVHPDDKPSVCFDCWETEAESLTRFAKYVHENAGATWIGWRCLQNDYGFPHLASRYEHLTGKQLPIPVSIIDLKDFLKARYGSEFAPHPRLERAAQANNVTMLNWLTGQEAAEVFQCGEFPKLRANIGRHCSVIRALYRKALQGEFLVAETPTNTTTADRQNSDSIFQRMLSAYTDGISDERFAQVAAILEDGGLTVNERLTKVYHLLPIPALSAQQLANLLGVSKTAVVRSDWWTQHRKNERANEVGRRETGHRERAKQREPIRRKEVAE